jgi:hypothetical protein
MSTSITALIIAGTAAIAAADQSPPALLADGPDWQPPAYEEVRAQALAWLDSTDADDDARRTATDRWTQDPVEGLALLERLARTFADVDPRAAELLRQCSQPRRALVPPSHAWLHDKQTPAVMAQNLRLLLGRWLVLERMHDEALEQLDTLRTEQVVAPAALLFYQSVAYHHLLEREKGLAAIERLLRGERQSPRRYIAIARLMEEDLKQLQDDTLDHIARRMRDVGRRLELGRANRRVREIEDGVIESLDKLIKKLEEQQKQQQQSAGGQGQNQSSRPARDSRILGGKGEGEVTKRDIGSQADWGSLPPKEREEALQQIGRDFPAHYRDVIEEYFRRKAAEGSER